MNANEWHRSLTQPGDTRPDGELILREYSHRHDSQPPITGTRYFVLRQIIEDADQLPAAVVSSIVQRGAVTAKLMELAKGLTDPATRKGQGEIAAQIKWQILEIVEGNEVEVQWVNGAGETKAKDEAANVVNSRLLVR